jgi:hypothetical protein
MMKKKPEGKDDYEQDDFRKHQGVRLSAGTVLYKQRPGQKRA